jgi:hypothetical protein
MFPPGRARLVTIPVATGSMEATRTMGIVVVARLASGTDGVPDAIRISTLRRPQLGRCSGKLVRARRHPVLDRDALALDVPELTHTLAPAPRP